jgi:diguanylate cyclase (GGDEF)-like protein
MAVAETLARNLRAFDVIARYGGDEFVLLLPETGDKAAEMVLEKLMDALRGVVQGRWPASFSIGAVTVEGPRTSLDRLIQQADKLVYAAKQRGKDCFLHRHLSRSGTSEAVALEGSGLAPRLLDYAAGEVKSWRGQQGRF